MSNREKLTLAAAAAGYEIAWKVGACKGGDYEAAFIGDAAWRPLNDDGDALRLAVDVSMRRGAVRLMLPEQCDRFAVADNFSRDLRGEDGGESPRAATRAAIVAYAAQVGLSLTKVPA